MPRLVTPFQQIPSDTVQAVSAVFGKGNVYRAIGDQANSLFADINLVDLDASHGISPEYTPVLALLTGFQYAEDLPDHRAVDALRTRMDWKYALHLPLVNTDLDYRKLCQFRSHTMHSLTASQALQNLVDGLAKVGLFRNSCESDVYAAKILARVCFISRLEEVMEMIFQTLEALAAYQPELLREHAFPHWYALYDHRLRPFQAPLNLQEQQELVQVIGKDITWMLQIATCKKTIDHQMLPEVRKLQQILTIHFDTQSGEALWRPVACASCGQVSL